MVRSNSRAVIRHGMLRGYFDLGKPPHGKPSIATWKEKLPCVFIVFRINLCIDWEGYRVGVVPIGIPHGPPEEIRTGNSSFECAVDVYFIDLAHRNRPDSSRPHCSH